MRFKGCRLPTGICTFLQISTDSVRHSRINSNVRARNYLPPIYLDHCDVTRNTITNIKAPKTCYIYFPGFLYSPNFNILERERELVESIQSHSSALKINLRIIN